MDDVRRFEHGLDRAAVLVPRGGHVPERARREHSGDDVGVPAAGRLVHETRLDALLLATHRLSSSDTSKFGLPRPALRLHVLLVTPLLIDALVNVLHAAQGREPPARLLRLAATALSSNGPESFDRYTKLAYRRIRAPLRDDSTGVR